MDFIDLVTDIGELIRIECKQENFDEVMDSIENAMKRRDWWSVMMYEGTSATYLGLRLDRVNMGKIVGIL